jgi:SAM-dependent methyltransferase
MPDLRNHTGRPLSSPGWLEAHHRAKLPERQRFAAMLAQLGPRRVVDLGCATGLWLDLLDPLLPPACEFVGFDSDPKSLTLAEERSTKWSRNATFEVCDIDANIESIPTADLTLVFNVIPYLQDPAKLFASLAERRERGAVAVRQYDGAALRFGPMETEVRALIEASLRSSVGASSQFRHYDLDDVFSLLQECRLTRRKIAFELFERTTPFPDDFVAY